MIVRISIQRRVVPLLLAALSTFSFSFIVPVTPANAADMSRFDAGNIMSNYVMSNKNSISESQIQTFLKSKNSCNDTNTAKASQYPHLQYNIKNGRFVCMADEVFNGESAARIIWQAGQDYDINPQVLIVLLEKEQGLVTDTWPNSNIQYRSATGYGCPDTAACDTQYYGFKNQVRNAANFFRAHLDNNPCWTKPHIPGVKRSYATPRGSCSGSEQSNSGVLFHPNATCGSTALNIKNRATSALYSYTPYQPNQAALNAGYGTGNSCSSYGNRNFWGLFTDWFGSTKGIDGEANGVYRLWNPSTKTHFMTGSVSEANVYISAGWDYDSTPFHSSTTGRAVYRLYSKTSKSHFFTTSTTEVSAYTKAGWINDGVVFRTPTTGRAVYRLFNKRTGGHIYLSSAVEISSYVRAGWHYDGVSFYSNDSVNQQNVYRFFNKSTGGHILVTGQIELGAYAAAGWHYDGVTAYSDSTGAVSVYRLFNKSTKSHFFTTSTTEVSAYTKAGWINDGVVFRTPTTGRAVYRLYSKTSKSHFFTTSTTEVSAYTKAGWINDGVVFYSNTKQAISRLYNTSTLSHRLVGNDASRNTLINSGWIDDGVILYGITDSSGTPVYELSRSSTNSFFYTTSSSEASVYASAGWVNNGIAFRTPASGGASVYRLYSTGTQKHFFTTDLNELNTYTAAGWINDGVVFYGTI